MNKFVAVVGQTASGKSSLAMELAARFNGEIICADSATVRRGLDIGAAKPTLEEQARVRHHLLDIVSADEKFTAARFKKLAEQAIHDIQSRNKLAIMVGGTGLYVDSVLYDYKFGVKNASDRHVMRDDCLSIGLRTQKIELKERIEQRVDAMLAAGLESEVRSLVDLYGWKCVGLKNVGYAQWQGYFEGQVDVAETRQLIIKATNGLAKRQLTWFKRNNSIQWFDTPVNLADVVGSLTTFLNT